MNEKRYTVLDLFCGCGGMSSGFEYAGFDILNKRVKACITKIF